MSILLKDCHYFWVGRTVEPTAFLLGAKSETITPQCFLMYVYYVTKDEI